MKSKSTTVKQYLDALPVDRRKAIGTVLRTIRKHLPKGYEERLSYGMPCWQVPLDVFPDTYNGQPLMYAALASQKSHMSVYLCNVYGMPPLRKKLEAGFRAAGKKLDMGKSCVRFRSLEDLPLDVIGKMISATPMKAFVRFAEGVYKKKR